MDVEFLGFAHEVFDGVWAQLGLNHLPKNKFPLALDEILRVLAPQGVLFLGMKQGDHEGYVSRGCFDERFSSCYRDDELRVHLERRFDLLDYFTVSTDRTNGSSGPIFLQYVCRKQ